MIVKDLKDFIELINYVANDNKQEPKNYINTEGLSKFKDSLYEVLQYIDKEIDTASLTPQKLELYNALNRLESTERDSLSKAMLTSYYTPDYIVNTISKSIKDYWQDKNLESINICEPSAGSGKFLEPFLEYGPTIDAIEIDSLTSKILRNNFSSPDVHIHNLGYENFVPNKKYDLIIGNVPFGNFSVYDNTISSEQKNLIKGKIHNYFFIKSVENLKPGGLLMLMTTSSMNNDSQGMAMREALMKDTNLVSCIRFSDETFKASKTKVVSDLLILQKPLSIKNSITSREQDFINTSFFDEERKMFPINHFLKNNPENIIGDLYLTQGFLGRETLSVKDNPNLNNEEVLKKLIVSDFESFSQKRLLDISIPVEKKTINIELNQQINDSILKAYPLAVPGNIIYIDNGFFKAIVNESNANLLNKIPVTVLPKDQQSISVLIELRDTYKYLKEEIKNSNIAKINFYQERLNEQYDLFSFISDSIGSLSNRKLLSLESESDLLLGLEIVEKGNLVKSDIFYKNFQSIDIAEPKVNSVEDSIALSFQKYGRLNNDYITEISGMELNVWVKEGLSKGLLFVDPIIKNLDQIESFDLSVPSRFLSGYVEGKLSIYQNQSLLNKDNKFSNLLDKNIIDLAKEKLIEAIPFKLNIAEINPNMGEPWIDNSIYEMFAKEHFDLQTFTIQHIQAIDKFKISGGYSPFANANYSVSTNSNSVNYSKIFEYAMIHNIPDYTKKIFRGGQEIRVADKETIDAVNIAVTKLNQSFSNWLLQKTDICIALENKYHLLNNAIVKEDYNLSLLHFDDITTLTPYAHQKNAVWQNVNQLGGIIDHEVGFGKTLTMAMTTMKKKQFQLIKKELVTGLNANYAEIYETYKQVYPKGKFLLVNPEDLSPEKKQTTFYKIANNDWDAVITAHSCLMKFPIAPHAQKEILNETINEIRNTVVDPELKNILSRGEINRLNKKLEDSEVKLKYAIDVINDKKENGTLIFDDLGFDSFTVDESHEFKNLSFTTKHSRVAGLGNQNDVQKTTNILSYIRHIQGIHKGDKGTTFASGTTISNSITELYLLFKYLRPSMLKEKGMNNFDQWARVYARKTNEYEENVTGMIKQKERFRFFVKVPELAKMYNDIANYADYNTFKIERPQAKTNLIAIEPYKEQLAYFEQIKKFGETKDPSYLTGRSAVSSSSEIQKAVGLICTNLGRKAALSLKLIDPDFPDNPKDKINTMAQCTLDYYNQFSKDKGTQLIFCDQGVPNSANYNLYAYIKSILIIKGIPEKEIAFIHDWDKKRKELFQKVNSGEIRVLLGSTPKMGVGVNVQQKIVALHHIDFPWRPTDMIQRNGRAERPGNLILPQYDNVLNINYYATKQSLDSYTFNLLQIKHNFILQIKNSSVSTRVIDEGLIDANGSMNFSEYMAACSSNQYLTKKLQVEKKLNVLIDMSNSYELTFRQKTNQLGFINTDIEKNQRIIEKLTDDYKKSGNLISHIINHVHYPSDKEVAKTLRDFLQTKFIKKDYEIPLAEFSNGFHLIVTPKDKLLPIGIENYQVFLKTPNNYKIGWKSNTFVKDDIEVAKYTDNCLSRIPFLIESEKSKLESNIKNQKIIQDVLANRVDNSSEINILKKEIKTLDNLIERENKKNNPEPDIDLDKGKGNKPKL